MEEMRKQVIVPVEEADAVRKLLGGMQGPDGADMAKAYKASFDSGISMTVTVTGGEKPRVDVGLLKDGMKVAKIPPLRQFFGTWKIAYDDVRYAIDVIAQREMKRTVTVPKAVADRISGLLSAGIGPGVGGSDGDGPVEYAAGFENGVTMHIRFICGEKEEDGGIGPCTEAVLCEGGSKVGYVCLEGTFFGTWSIGHGDIRYTVEVIPEAEEHLIWHNDECIVFDGLKEDYPDEDEDTLWEMAGSQITEWLEDEKVNLDVEAPGEIVAIGTLERWDRPRSAYKELGTANIGEAVAKTIASFGGINTFRVYVKGTGLYVSQTGHDNPVNPSVFELRAYSKDFDWFKVDSNEQLMDDSQPIGSIVSAVYGW